MPRALEPLPHPLRRRRLGIDALDHAPDRSAGRRRASSTRTVRRALAVDRRRVAATAAMSRRARDRGDLARDAEQRQAIGAVGRELEREQRVVEIERVAQIGAGVERSARAAKQARRVVGDAELLRRAEHAVGLDAAHVGLLDRRVRRAARARRARRARSCPAAALGAPQTICSGSPPPASTVQTRSRSAFGCRRDVEHARDDHAAECRRGRHAFLDFEPGHGQPVARAPRCRAADRRACAASVRRISSPLER